MRVAVLRPGVEPVQVVEASDDPGARLDWMHETIGVDEIDMTTLGRFALLRRDTGVGVQMVSDDLFLSREPRAPRNAAASAVYNPPGLSEYAQHPILGVVVLTAFDESGETVDLPFAAIDELRRLGLTVEVRP